MAIAWLHLRGQFTYHSEAHIVGSRAGLTALRDAINSALDSREATADVFASDGEGYQVLVRRSATIRDMGEPPYLDEIGRQIATFERDFVLKMEKRRLRPLFARQSKEGRDG